MLKQTIATLLMAGAALCGSAERPELHFNNDGTFKIIQFTDLHINDENESSKLRNDSTYRLIEQLAETQKPDLLVLTGDCIWNTRDAIFSVEAALRVSRKHRCSICHMFW